MGLVTRRSLQIDKLFDQLAVDPKKRKPVDKDKADKKDTDKENSDKQK
ncbi:SPJ_0845 family protein [Limosilactobacillus sp.]|nr:SPJ_0845 family protein [Limosilactobacillus sp.]MCH3922560.1 hypothetical protein [Limosilactobacillus sp.]MCH3927242.1 hypothetical protein [Limosilactobacillus sp.]